MAMSPRAAHHDDDIIADLPSFLEMATYEDPMDDFALFFKNACRWARYEVVIQVGPEDTFYPFAALPEDVRLMIWRECIPSEIHLVAERADESCVAQKLDGNHVTVEASDSVWGELNGPRTAFGSVSRDCHSICFRGSGQKLPVIAKVNHESRVLALRLAKRKSKRYNLAFVHRLLYGRGRLDRLQESPLWLDEKYDTVLINTRHIAAAGYPADAVFLTEDGKLDHKADRLIGMTTRDTIQVAIFAALFIDETPLFHFYDALTTAKPVDLVVGVFSFDGMSDSEAAVTGLFGLFGEQSMGLVPVDNPRSLRKLYTAHTAFRPQCYAEYFGWVDNVEVMCTYVPDGYKDWNKWCGAHDFNAYYEKMRGFASSIMIACEDQLRSRMPDGGKEASRQWQMKVEATFKKTFQPVFLVHRCINAVLMNYRESI